MRRWRSRARRVGLRSRLADAVGSRLSRVLIARREFTPWGQATRNRRLLPSTYSLLQLKVSGRSPSHESVT
eukprot:365738-Chlamydomonas_euryale.AAC.31